MPNELGENSSNSNQLWKLKDTDKAEKEHLELKKSNFINFNKLFGHMLRSWLDILFWEHYPGGEIQTDQLCSQISDSQELRFHVLNVYADGAVLASLTKENNTNYIHISPFSRTAEILVSDINEKKIHVYSHVDLETGVGTKPRWSLRTDLNKELELLLSNAYKEGHKFVELHSVVDPNIPREEWIKLVKSFLKKCGN